MSAVTGEDYIEGLKDKISSLSDHVEFHGPYDQVDTLKLMGRYHFVILGSRWYENSPVVIQESFAAGRPIIYPAHGGMLEKVGGMGLSYRPSNPISLSNILCYLNSEKYNTVLKRVTVESASIVRRVRNALKSINTLLDN